jgi:hypothetical protein
VRVFTVTKPGGTRDYEFEAYTQLMEDVGIDVSNSPRVPEPGTNRRWLYAWTSREEAQRFARELGIRTHDTTWDIRELNTEAEARGPVAPLDIVSVHGAEGITYYLTPRSRARVLKAYPHLRLSASLFLANERQENIVRNHGPNWWAHVCKLLTGLTDEQIRSLGGYRVLLPSGRVWHEETPEVPAA